MIIFLIWFGMVLVAGIKFRHVAVVFLLGAITLTALWQYAFYDYQKTRIMTFMDPLSDIRGAGYNAYQSTVAVGSGEIFGKGIGYGTQSKLQFLPEYETDFIFAAYAEEWGLIGVLILFLTFAILIWRLLLHAVNGASNFEKLFATGVAIFLYAEEWGLIGVLILFLTFAILIWRLLLHAVNGASNFEKLFATGVAIFLLAHFFIHVGINIGLLPVTGTTIPFLSYGGSHLVTEFVAVGMVLAMRRYTPIKAEHNDDLFIKN